MVRSIQRRTFLPGLFVTAIPRIKRRARGMSSQRKSSPGKSSILHGVISSAPPEPRRALRNDRIPLMIVSPILWRS